MLTTGVDVILGRDFLRDHECTIAMGREKDTLYFKDHDISIILNDREQPLRDSKVPVVLDGSLYIPPFSEIEVMARVPASASSQTWMVEGHKQQRTVVTVARAVVTPTGTSIPLRLLNWRNEPVSISKGTAIADLEPVLGADISTETVATACTDPTEVPADATPSFMGDGQQERRPPHPRRERAAFCSLFGIH